jgi:hypothetical protein
MKTNAPSPSSSPRLLCRIVRPWHAVTGGAARHAETCAGCRTYFAAAAALDQSLRRAAPTWAEATTPAPSTGFEQRLLNAVRTPAAPTESRPARTAHLGWAAATALTAVIAVALIRPAGGPTRATMETDAQLLAAAVGNASRGLVEKVIPTTGALVADNPLQQEFGAIRSDARSALNFLALNFLPAATVADAPASPL